MNNNNNLQKLLQFNIKMRQKNCPILHPLLIARSGSGKTTTLINLAKQMNYNYYVLLLQTMLEYEICGIPSINQKTNIVQFAYADWIIKASKNKYMIIIDEIDKPRQEIISSILTLLSSFKLNDIELNPETIFVLAGQQCPDITESLTNEALRRRLIVIPKYWWYDNSYFYKHFSIDLTWYDYMDNIEFPKIYPSPRELEYLIMLYKYQIFSLHEYQELLSFNYDSQFVQQFIAALQQQITISPEVMIELLTEDLTRSKNLNINDIILLASYGNKISVEHFCAFLPHLAICDIDSRQKFLENLYEAVSNTEELFIEEDVDYCAEMIFRCGQVMGHYLLQKNGLTINDIQPNMQLEKGLTKEDIPIVVDLIIQEIDKFKKEYKKENTNVL